MYWMKKMKYGLVCLALILLLVSGCAAKPGSATGPAGAAETSPATENTGSQGDTATGSQESGASSKNRAAISDEKSDSMHKGGFFAKNGNILIYYAEPQDGIYRVDTAKNTVQRLVKTDSVQKLYFDGTYVYYMPYYYRGRGIYRVDLEGNTEKICANSSLQLWLTDDKIYFTDQIGFDDINQTPRGNLCTMNKDGTNIQILIRNVGNYFSIQDEWIYYTHMSNRDLYRAALDGSRSELLAEGRTYITAADNDYLIYTDYEDGEAQHLLNARTGENVILGQFGGGSRYNGQFYIVTEERGSDGIPSSAGWSVFQVDQETGKAVKRAFLEMNRFGLDGMSYVYGDWLYFYTTDGGPTGQRGTYRVKLPCDDYEAEYLVDGYLFYLDGFGYYIEGDGNSQPVTFARLNLQTGEVTRF
ncbi:MAG: DUF5050 domain-containing protein [Candidatus Dehalobacter alkaniphilus]|jgi:hypothetical protein|uniref:DUF5050 domain-containing protein n=2 Tax=Dehalobacter TaxID=56112 RepID=UPI001FA6BDEE|nr:DUF5050 domain-containing protein [Dehalobacter sp. DCA]